MFLLFFWNFLLPFGKERNKTIVFIISPSKLFPTYFGLERHRNGIFQFLSFFSIFLEFSLARREGTKRSNNFCFLSLSAFSNLFFPWNEAVMVFFNFWIFFAIFLEFSLQRREGTKRSDNFYFLSLSAFSHLFWLRMKP